MKRGNEMKTSKLDKEYREIRREEIMFDRMQARSAHAKRGVAILQSRTQIKVFGKRGKATREYGVYPHSSTRQRVRYARQIAAGQLNISVIAAPVAAVEAPPIAKKKRVSRAKAVPEVCT
jgi:hypothetical protein